MVWQAPAPVPAALMLIVRRYTMNAPRDAPGWITLVAALCALLIVFLATYFGAAFLGGIVCGASLRFHLPWAGFSCKHLPAILLTVVYFAFLFTGPIWIRTLRTMVVRVYRLTIAGAGRDA